MLDRPSVFRTSASRCGPRSWTRWARLPASFVGAAGLFERGAPLAQGGQHGVQGLARGDRLQVEGGGDEVRGGVGSGG